MNKKVKGNLLLLLTSVIWGISFVSQSVGADKLSPFAFNGIRSILGAISLIPVILITDKKRKKSGTFVSEKHNKTFLKAGVFCGTALGVASGIQTYALKYTTAGKCGFITALYILFVPIIGIMLGKQFKKIILVGVAFALSGMYFLCLHGSDMSFNIGDIMTLICSLCFSVHIMLIDYYSPKADGVKLSCMQFFVAGLINCTAMLFDAVPTAKDIIECSVPILYAGIMSCGVAYTLQILGQKHTNPTVASILMSFESVFAVIAGWILLGDSMTMSEVSGCVLMFAAIVTVQLPTEKFSKKNQTNV